MGKTDLKPFWLLQTCVYSVSRAALPIAIALGLSAFMVSECDGDESDEQRTAQLLSQMRSLAEHTSVKFAKTQRQIELVKTPVFRYSDQPRHFIDATLWVWTENGRPAAFQKIEALEFGDEETRRSLWQMCFASVSPDLVAAQWAAGARFQSTEPGLAFRALSEAPTVASGNIQRRRQAREIVRKFSARIVTNPTDNTTQEMRLLTTPLFDYQDLNTGEFLGSVFGLSTNGTNPDVLIVLEIQGQDKLAWHFAPARMTSGGVTLTYRDIKVWETKWLNASEGPFPTWIYFVIPRKSPDEAADRHDLRR